MSAKPERCKACGRLKKRSNEANRRLWLLYHLLSDKLRPQGKQYSAETWHTYAKQRFLGCDEVKLPNNKVLQIPRSTADLDKDAFSEFMAAVEQFGIEHDVYLDDI